MDSIKKLVSEKESNLETFKIVSHFLKTMGWWYYWKKYTKTQDYSHHAYNFPNHNWVEVRSPYNVFGCTNFSTYLKKNYGIDVYIVLDFFIVYTSILHPSLFEKCDYDINQRIVDSLKRKGIYQLWEKELQLVKSRESE